MDLKFFVVNFKGDWKYMVQMFCMERNPSREEACVSMVAKFSSNKYNGIILSQLFDVVRVLGDPLCINSGGCKGIGLMVPFEGSKYYLLCIQG